MLLVLETKPLFPQRVQACTRDSSHPVGVTDPFIFPLLKETLSPVASQCTRYCSGTAITLQLSPAHTPTLRHVYSKPIHRHTSSPRGLRNLHVTAITNADNTLRSCSICIPVPQRARPLSISVTGLLLHPVSWDSWYTVSSEASGSSETLGLPRRAVRRIGGEV